MSSNALQIIRDAAEERGVTMGEMLNQIVLSWRKTKGGQIEQEKVAYGRYGTAISLSDLLLKVKSLNRRIDQIDFGD